MVNNNPNGNEETIDSLLEKGLYFFGANKVTEAIRAWEQVLTICPGEPRATDYLSSAGVTVPGSSTNTIKGIQPMILPEDKSPKKPSTSRAKLRVVPTQDRGDVEILDLTQLVAAPAHTRLNDPLRQPQSSAEPPEESRRKLWPILLGALLLVGVAIVLILSRGSKTEDGTQVATGSADQTGEEAVVVVARATDDTLPDTIDPVDSSGSLPNTDDTPPIAKLPPVDVERAPEGSLNEPSDKFFVVELQVIPTSAKIEIDGVEVGTGGLVQRLERDGKVHKLVIQAPGFMPQTLSFVDAPPPEQIRLRARKTARAKTRRPEKVVKQQPPEVVVQLPKVKPPQPKVKPKPPKIKPKADDPKPRRTDNRDPWQ